MMSLSQSGLSIASPINPGEAMESRDDIVQHNTAEMVTRVWDRVPRGNETVEPESNATIMIESRVDLPEQLLNEVYEAHADQAKPLENNGYDEWLVDLNP